MGTIILDECAKNPEVRDAVLSFAIDLQKKRLDANRDKFPDDHEARMAYIIETCGYIIDRIGYDKIVALINNDIDELARIAEHDAGLQEMADWEDANRTY